jgi:hypothetical protein
MREGFDGEIFGVGSDTVLATASVIFSDADRTLHRPWIPGGWNLFFWRHFSVFSPP